MHDPLATYLQDHLAGAKFAIELLNGLSVQTVNKPVAQFASWLLDEVIADRSTLQEFVDDIGEDSSRLKEMAAWTAQKASRFKLNLEEPLGIFEAVEMLALGVQGKLALWNAIRVVQADDNRLAGLNIDELVPRAIKQYEALEELRLQLAPAALQRSAEFIR